MRVNDIKLRNVVGTVTNEEKALVLKYAKICMKELSKKKYEISGLNGKKLKIDIHTQYGARGCAEWINVGVGKYRKKYKTMTEYDTFCRDKVIGSIYNTSPEVVIATIVAHEISHHIQYRYCPYINTYRKGYRKPHGDVFKLIYSFLRGAIINPMLEEHGGYIGKFIPKNV